jgi:5-methylcytosine-specific restriction endonuclease McrA
VTAIRIARSDRCGIDPTRSIFRGAVRVVTPPKNHPGKPKLKGKRLEVYLRDDFICQGPCGRRLPPEHPQHKELTLDHRIPRSRGGSGDPENLQTMRGSCNRAKGNKMPEELGEDPAGSGARLLAA